LLSFSLKKNFFCSLEYFSIGFTDGNKPDAPADLLGIGGSLNSNSYGLDPSNSFDCYLDGRHHPLEYQTGPVGVGSVFGCGLLINSKNELAVFFTHNGILMGKF
jgi:hypothetical protein